MHHISPFLSQGTNIRLAQHIFSALYLVNLALVFRIMVKTRKVREIVEMYNLPYQKYGP